jgi:phosphate transport system protein
MMFRQLFEAWRRKPILLQMCEELVHMLGDAHWMFRSVTTLLFEGDGSDPKLVRQLYERDITINKAERHLRKQLVEHLSFLPGKDVPTCLILMSVVKDAERIGDYCKNILEVAGWLRAPLAGGRYGDEFRALMDQIAAAFEPTAKCFQESDATLGHDVLEKTRALAQSADGVIDRLLDDELGCRQAVSYTLLARYLKRVAAHLANIASSTVMPLHKLDFFDEKWEKKGLKRP